MDWEQYKQHKAFAGEKKPSMHRRRVGHDYGSRRMYLITMTVEGRQPLLGQLVGNSEAPDGSSEAPQVTLSPLGERVRQCWMDIPHYHPEISVVKLQVMPDHLHGILFVREQMGVHLGQVIKGFKAGCNKAYRELRGAVGGAAGGAVGCAATLSQHRGPQGQGGQPQGPQGQGGQPQAQGAQGGQPQGAQGGQPQGQPAKRDRSKDDREHGLLWALGYNDHILEGPNELEHWVQYLHDNPRRLAMKRAHPELFRVRFGITVGTQTYSAIGNESLLHYPHKVQVQLTRRLTEEQIQEQVGLYMEQAEAGVIPVSPAISKGEQAVMRAVLNAGLPLIFLTPWGFNTFSKPGHQYFDACARGQLLLLAPWPHQNERIPLTRSMCLALNAMAKELCQQH